MTVVEASAVIPLNPEDTWDLMFGDEGQRLVEVLGNVKAVENYEMRADGTPRYTMVRKVGPLTMSSTSDYSVFERPHRTVSHTRDPGAPYGGTFYTYHEPVAGGTRLTFRAEMRPQNLPAAVMMPVVRRLFARQLQQDVDAVAKTATRRGNYRQDHQRRAVSVAGLSGGKGDRTDDKNVTSGTGERKGKKTF